MRKALPSTYSALWSNGENKGEGVEEVIVASIAFISGVSFGICIGYIGGAFVDRKGDPKDEV